MVIAAKNGHKELFQLFKDWKGGQLLTTEVKIAQLYYMMETEDEEDNTSFMDLLNSLLPTEEEKVSLYFFLKQWKLQVSNFNIGGGTLLQHACEKDKQVHVKQLLSAG